MINTRIGAAMKSPRSIIFYAWAGVVLQALLVVGVVIQAMQIANLTARGDFLDAQRAVRGYQATKQDRFLATYYDDQDQFVVSLRMLRGLAWPAVLSGVRMQANTAQAAFQAGDRAVAAAPGSGTASRLYSRASASADTVRIPLRANGSVEQGGMPQAAVRPLDKPQDHRPRPVGAQPDRALPGGELR
jgi:hypothetical protein